MGKFATKILPGALFAAFIGVFFVLSLVTPDRGFSGLENRNLAQKPEFSANALFAGGFTLDYENYITDQFPLRDEFVKISSLAERALGKTDISGVLIGSKGLLVSPLNKPDGALLEANMRALERFAQSLDVPVCLGIVPTAAGIYPERLPANAPTADQSAILEDIRRGVPSATWADIFGRLWANKGEYICFNTDHHWTARGAYFGYAAVAGALGFEPLPLGEAFKSISPFYGTAASAAGWLRGEGDRVELFARCENAEVTAYENGESLTVPVYDYGAEGKKDKYLVFFGGNYPEMTIKTGNEGGKLLVVKDSYANALLPFLCAHYSEITVLDLRYFKRPVSELADGADAVVVLYGISAFNTDTNIVFLR